MRRSIALSVALAALALGPLGGVASAAVTSPCPGDQGDPTTTGWALSTTTFDNAYTRHAYVGNGYLSQRVPATGTGYVGTTLKGVAALHAGVRRRLRRRALRHRAGARDGSP